MSFEQATGDWDMVKLPTKASTTYSQGMMVANDGTDNVPVTAATQQNLKGIVQEAKANDSTTTSIHILEPSDWSATFYADMTSGETISKANEGDSFDFAADGLTVSTNSTYDALTLVKYVSTTKGVFKFNPTTGIEN